LDLDIEILFQCMADGFLQGERSAGGGGRFSASGRERSKESKGEQGAGEVA
jgi:hypothetical protein